MPHNKPLCERYLNKDVQKRKKTPIKYRRISVFFLSSIFVNRRQQLSAYPMTSSRHQRSLAIGGWITVRQVSNLTRLVESKPVKLDTSRTVMLPPMVSVLCMIPIDVAIANMADHCPQGVLVTISFIILHFLVHF